MFWTNVADCPPIGLSDSVHHKHGNYMLLKLDKKNIVMDVTEKGLKYTLWILLILLNTNIGRFL